MPLPSVQPETGSCKETRYPFTARIQWKADGKLLHRLFALSYVTWKWCQIWRWRRTSWCTCLLDYGTWSQTLTPVNRREYHYCSTELTVVTAIQRDESYNHKVETYPHFSSKKGFPQRSEFTPAFRGIETVRGPDCVVRVQKLLWSC
jgi:hypothetical protein